MMGDNYWNDANALKGDLHRANARADAAEREIAALTIRALHAERERDAFARAFARYAARIEGTA